jgi:hypothetical protein
MSQTENPALTLIRLLRTYAVVVKDDGSVADVRIGQESYDRELLKGCDGQITVSVDRGEENTLSFDGDLRRRLGVARVNIWSVDKPECSVAGRAIRDSINADVYRVIRERRNRPNTVEYSYAGVGTPSKTHEAFHTAAASEPSPTDSGWSELADGEYQKLWNSDDVRFSESTLESGKYAFMLFSFKIDAQEEVISRLVLKFEGYGVAPAGNGVTVKVWNSVAGAWQNAVSGTGDEDEVLIVMLASNLPDYVDADGRVYLLARTVNPSDEADAAVLYCDYAGVELTVRGITHADVTGFRDSDDLRVKPLLWHTEFTVRTWLIETVRAA